MWRLLVDNHFRRVFLIGVAGSSWTWGSTGGWGALRRNPGCRRFLCWESRLVLFLLHDGKARIAHVAYPLVGKMVNIAQMMGLATDPDEFPGRYTLFDAELRRRVWWDIYYYDVYVSRLLMLLPPV